jgi:type II secretory pathway pseudopilin PulG
LVETLVVVCILALVAALVLVGFRKHALNMRAAEASNMLMEFAVREQAFRKDAGRYVPLRADGHGQLPSPDEDAAAFYPQPADAPALASVRQSTRTEDRELWPPGWRAVGLRPKTDLSHCTYLVNAGESGRPDPGLRYGSQLLSNHGEGPWFYALAACNMVGPARYPEGVTVYGLSSEDFKVRTFNEGL